MSDRIRIVDIAREAGVSKGTVDRVLHNRGHVSPIAKARVLAAMQALDYRPNMIASALAYNRLWRIAALIPTYTKDPFWRLPSQGIEQGLRAVRDYGISVTFFRFRDADTADFERQADAILAEAFDAVIVAPIYTHESSRFLDRCDERGIPYIQINTYLERRSDYFLGYIGQDSYSSGRVAAKLLNMQMQAGQTAMILHLEKGYYNSQHLLEKERGFKQYFAQSGRPGTRTVQASFENVFATDDLRDFLAEQLSRYPEVSGIFVTTSKLFHIVPHLDALGYPDLFLIGFDLIQPNLRYLEAGRIQFLINQNPVQQGYLSVVSIFNHLIRKEAIPKIRHLPLDIVIPENVRHYLDEERQSHLVI